MRSGATLRATLLALGLAVLGREGHSEPPPAGDPAFLNAGRNASAHALDSTLAEVRFEDWIQTTLGGDVPLRWETNDCGEASGSPSDSSRDLPVCAEASAAISGGRELVVRLVVGTAGRGLVPSPELYFAEVAGPDSSPTFHRLSEVGDYLERERPFARNDSIYLDERRNVHVITATGKDVRLMREGPFREPKLSPDGRIIGMLPVSVIEREDPSGGESIEVATEVWIYQGGIVAQRFEPGGFIREWNFVSTDSLAIYSGGLHFAGFYVLYDVATGEERGRAEDPVTDQSPGWVRRLAP